MRTVSFRSLPALTLAGLTLGLAGCIAPRIALDDAAERVAVGPTPPNGGFEALGPVEGVDGESCGSRGYEGTYDAALVRLKNEAARRYADYVQITATTPPAFRPGCFDNHFTLAGVAYRRVGGGPVSMNLPMAPAPVAAPPVPAVAVAPVAPVPAPRPASEVSVAPAPAPVPVPAAPPAADTPTARKLVELQDLRARNLISAEEYERLRRKVLAEAY